MNALQNLFAQHIEVFEEHRNPTWNVVAIDLQTYFKKWPTRSLLPDLETAKVERNLDGTRFEVTMPFAWQVSDGFKVRNGRSILKVIVVLLGDGDTRGINGYALASLSESQLGE